MKTGTACAIPAELFIFEERVQLFHKGVDVLKLAVDRGKAHIATSSTFFSRSITSSPIMAELTSRSISF